MIDSPLDVVAECTETLCIDATAKERLLATQSAGKGRKLRGLRLHRDWVASRAFVEPCRGRNVDGAALTASATNNVGAEVIDSIRFTLQR